MRLSSIRASGFALGFVTVALGVSTLAVARGNGDAALTPIYAIQGNGDSTPLEGRQVAIEGVVTGDFQRGDQLGGFFVQDARGDGDAATSDALFVYLPPRSRFARVDVKPGDRVRVAGIATEFRGQTQLDRVSELVGLMPGTPLAPLNIVWPLPIGQTPERLEGMLVRLPQTLTVSGNYGLDRYGELVLSAGGRLFNPTNGQGGSTASNARRRLVLDDGSSRTRPMPIPYVERETPAKGAARTNAAVAAVPADLPNTAPGTGAVRPGEAEQMEFQALQSFTRRAGDTVRGLTGVLSYAFDSYRLQPTVAPVFVRANPRPARPRPVGGDIKIASFNVQNYFTTLRSQNRQARGAQTAAEFAVQSAKVVAALKTLNADVVGLMEIENNGATAINDLVAKLNAAYGATVYAVVADAPQGMGTDAIKVAFIYKPGRVELAGQAASEPNEIFDRPPLAQTFRARAPLSGSFTAVINHFKSKGGCPPAGDVDNGQGCWNNRRVAQAQALLAFIEPLRARDPDVLVLGDLNAYSAEDPLKILAKGGLLSLEDRLPVAQRYSFVYDAQSGSLDHALATPALNAQVTGITKWHINADEPGFVNYNFKPQAAADTPDAAGTDIAAAKPAAPARPASANKPIGAGVAALPYRSSDHDPIVVGLRLRESATTPAAAR